MARTRYDVGLHGETAGAPVEVGVAVDGDDAIGVSVEAPTVGHLLLSLTLSADGAARLVALERNGAPVAIDETQALRLEAELIRSKARHAELETARDQARDRAAALRDELGLAQQQLDDQAARFEQGRHELQEQIAAANGATAIEQEQRLEALQDRDRVRAELAELTTRHEAGATEAAAQAQDTIEQLTASVEEGREQLRLTRAEHDLAHAALEQRAQTLEGQLADATRRADEAEAALQAAERRATELDQQLAAAEAEAQTASAGAEQQVGELHAQLSAAETAAQALAEQTDQQLGGLQAQLTAAAARAEQAEAEVAATRDAEGSQLSLAHARQEAAESERDQLQRQLATATDAAAQAEAGASAATAERDELQQRVEALQTELATATSAATGAAELRAQVEGLTAELATASTRTTELASQTTDAAHARIAALELELAEAQVAARQAQGSAATLLADRDEARGVARSLHTRLASEADAAKKELARAQLQIDSLGRQLETERGTRARLTAERDALRESVVRTTPPTQKLPRAADPSRLTTTPYDLKNLKGPAGRADALWGDEATSLTQPAAEPDEPATPLVKLPKKP